MDTAIFKRRVLPFIALGAPVVVLTLAALLVTLAHGGMRARIAELDRDIALMERRLQAVEGEARAVGSGEDGAGVSDLVADGTAEVAAALASEQVTEAAQMGACSLISARTQLEGALGDATIEAEQDSEFHLALDYRCPFEGVLAVLWHVATTRPLLLTDELTLAQAGTDEAGVPAFSLKLSLRGFSGEGEEDSS